MATKASNTTPNYHLSQWEPEDHILRTDFNADFAAIDEALHSQKTGHATALAAVEQKIALLRIASAALSANGAALTLDLSGMNLSRFAKLELQIHNAAATSDSVQTLQLTVNSDSTDGHYMVLSRLNTVEAAALYAGQISPYGSTASTVLLQELEGQLMAENRYFRTIRDGAESGENSYSLWKQGNLADIRTLTLKAGSGNLKKNTAVTVYGWLA